MPCYMVQVNLRRSVVLTFDMEQTLAWFPEKQKRHREQLQKQKRLEQKHYRELKKARENEAAASVEQHKLKF